MERGIIKGATEGANGGASSEETRTERTLAGFGGNEWRGRDIGGRRRKDADVTEQPQRLDPVYVRSLNFRAEEAFWKVLAGEIKKRTVVEMRKGQVGFLNPAFVPPETNEKGQKDLDFWRSDGVQEEVHLKMGGVEVRKKSAMEGDRVASHDRTDAFSHMGLNQEFALLLAFSHDGEYYAFAAMPSGVRYGPRVFEKALRYAVAYSRAQWGVHRWPEGDGSSAKTLG
jgi:hypothetical protein